MRKAKQLNINHQSEFELDLAPLLAVMVKLVPVLLISTAFVQFRSMQSELPQFVHEALLNQEIDKNKHLSLNILQDGTTYFSLKHQNEINNYTLKNKFKDLDPSFMNELSEIAEKIKTENTEVFLIELKILNNMKYESMIGLIDELYKTKNNQLYFSYIDKDQKSHTTNLMFPEVKINLESHE